MPGSRQGLLGWCRTEFADVFPQLASPVILRRGILATKDGRASQVTGHAITDDDGITMTYDWRHLPRWYHRLFWATVLVSTCAALWGVAIDFSAGAIGHGLVNMALLLCVLCMGVGLHFWEEREFQRWRSRRSDRAAEEIAANTPAPGCYSLCRLWLVVFSVVAIASSLIGLLLAEVCVFTTATSHHQAPSNLMKGTFPSPVVYSTQTVIATLICTSTLGLVYYSCHWGPYIWMAKQGDMPPRVWWVTVLYDWIFCGCVWGKLTFEASPHLRDTMSYGMFTITIINSHFRIQTRALRTWGMPLGAVGSQSPRLLCSRMLALSLAPCFYYISVYGFPPVVTALLGHGFEYPDEPRGLFTVHSLRASTLIMGSFRSAGSVLSERTDALTAALAAADAPAGLRWWYKRVADLPLSLLMGGTAWLCIPSTIMMIKSSDRLVELWPKNNWMFVPAYAQVQYWIGIFVVMFDSIVGGLLNCHTLVRLIICNWLGTIFNNFIASIIGNVASKMTDPLNFQPELLEVPLAVVGAWLTIFGALELSLDDVSFWLYMAYAKGYSLVVDTAPVGEMRAAMRRPERFPELFRLNFPFEGVRACCVANQIAELAVTVIVLAPVVPVWLRTRGAAHEAGDGYTTRGTGAMWLMCGDEASPAAVGLVCAKLLAFLACCTAANALQFWLCGAACRRFAARMARRPRPPPAAAAEEPRRGEAAAGAEEPPARPRAARGGAPPAEGAAHAEEALPSGELRSASQILEELVGGQRGGLLKLVWIIFSYGLCVPLYLLRANLVPERCNGMLNGPGLGDLFLFAPRPTNATISAARARCS
ncbi:unnamed protein product [Prorocentrum cordatum]|uniref:Glycerophosphocholine acyltransferase 1 n=1 Tax=Prorocentrum cordatum TaxID=2364126 RepID=A0ABN9UEM9_9DINO|nr:unnamed protein product [Polarella glacialis]